MLDKLFTKEPYRELEKLYSQEQSIMIKIEALNTELAALENPEADFNETTDYVGLAAKVTGLKNEIVGLQTALKHIGVSRVKLCRILDSEKEKKHFADTKIKEAELEKIHEQINLLQPQLASLQEQCSSLAIDITQRYNWTPLPFWAREWPIEKIKQVMDSNECPFVDRAYIKELVKSYDVFTKKCLVQLMTKVIVNDVGEITHVVDNPILALQDKELVKRYAYS